MVLTGAAALAGISEKNKVEQTFSNISYGLRSGNLESKLWCPQFSQKKPKFIALSKEDTQDSEFRSLFGRIEETINCHRDLPTFKINSL